MPFNPHWLNVIGLGLQLSANLLQMNISLNILTVVVVLILVVVMCLFIPRRKIPFVKIFISFLLVLIPMIVLKVLHQRSVFDLILWGPIIEESCKLFLLVFLIGLVRCKGWLGSTWKSEFQWLVLLTIFTGVLFAVFEGFTSYLPSRSPPCRPPHLHSFRNYDSSTFMETGLETR